MTEQRHDPADTVLVGLMLPGIDTVDLDGWHDPDGVGLPRGDILLATSAVATIRCRNVIA